MRSVAIALAGFLFSLTPVAERLDHFVLDAEWSLLRKFDPKPAPDDILIVGIDEASVRAIDAPGLWHEPVGRALEKIAAARPRGIAIDLQLPERSYNSLGDGLDQRLVQGIAAARISAPVVGSLSIDPVTHAARPVHAPVLAALGEEALGIGLLGRDGDGVTRRFSLALPTQDGAYPTLVGRICRALAVRCTDGLIDYALGEPFRYVPLRDIAAAKDAAYLDKLFRGRWIFVGDVRATDRVAAPWNLAGWEPPSPSTPAVVVQAQSLRSAIAGAPSRASRPWVVMLVAFAALVALNRDWRTAWASAALTWMALLVAGTVLLRAGTQLDLVAPAVTALAAALAAPLWRTRKS
jgi:adenylate cyclase